MYLTLYISDKKWNFIPQQICSSGSYYADLLFDKMIKNNYYDKDPSQFDISEQVCSTRISE